MITKRQRDACTTHHNACDCREYSRERLSVRLQQIAILIEELDDSSDDSVTQHVLDQIYDIAKGFDGYDQQ